MKVVGLTGGIGSGKSLVARMFASCGAQVIDADQLAREAVARGTPELADIVSRFGPTVLDPSGELDRRRMAEIVFKDPTAREALNQIVHPAVRNRAMARIQTLAEQGANLVVYDVPLLYETGLDRQFPEVIVVNV